MDVDCPGQGLVNSDGDIYFIFVMLAHFQVFFISFINPFPK